jgi:hypothetical protein
MAVVRDRTKKEFVIYDSALAAEDLSTEQYCAVYATGAATGAMTVSKCTGQGAIAHAILLNAPASGAIAELALEGSIIEWRAHSTFNAGDELTVHDGNGRCESAASGDFVFAIAREGSNGAGHAVSVKLTGYYKP